MPQSRIALQKLLVSIEKQIGEIEAKLPTVTDPSESERLVSAVADLHVAQAEVKAALTDGGEIKRNPESRR